MRTSPTDLLQTTHKGISSHLLKGMEKTWIANKRAKGRDWKLVKIAQLE